MESIRRTIDNTLYSYVPGEFLPVFRDGKLDNKTEFMAYKAERFALTVGRAAIRTANTIAHIANMIGVMAEHASNN